MDAMELHNWQFLVINYPLVMTNIAIEHGHKIRVSFPFEIGGSFHSCVNVYQRVSETIQFGCM